MLFTRAFKIVFIMVAASLAVLIVTAQDDSETQAKIESAMSAAPAAIAQDATILDWEFDADGKFVVLREGTNGWSCLPDDPSTPVNNPICLDDVVMEWFYALLAGEEPSVTVPGFSYQLQGDEAFSNSDPGVTEPAADHWMSTAPYMMVILPAEVDLSGFSTDEHSDGPFVMWAGTPYQHIMVPVGDAVLVLTAQDDSETQAKIENAMSAAPAAIAQDATILDWEFDADGKFVVLREGTNGWTCLPDDPGTPTNNPICLDEVFMEWFYAFMGGDEPNVTVPGFVYTLQGEQVFSNSDPGTTEPAADHWMSTAPYMSIVLPASVDLSDITTDEHSDGPFVMWAGTPYQHLMVPVGDSEQDQ
ncbi:MAG: hypothetical protein JNJ61_18290 [Anaerolineae bacterium]|nr:hypothetical protein [Anaerolineae bacterium]